MASLTGALRDVRQRSRAGRREAFILFGLVVFALSLLWFMPPFTSVSQLLPSGDYFGLGADQSKPLQSNTTDAESLKDVQSHQNTTYSAQTGLAQKSRPAVDLSKPVVELERIIMGDSFERVLEGVPPGDVLPRLKEAFLDRLSTPEKKVEVPECQLYLARYESSGILIPVTDRADTEPLTIAINLHNSEGIIPALSLALIEFVFHLQPTRRIYISIFENGSKDRTRDMLGQLASALLAVGIDGILFRSSVLVRSPDVERIYGLANLRNEALYPLLPYAGNGTLLFINDVVTCGFDLIELVHQIHLQDAHVAMSTDWQVDENDGKVDCRLRDIWVARGINGDMAYPHHNEQRHPWEAPTGRWTWDLWSTQTRELHNRWWDGRPIPVYSGWNGAIAFRAELFTHYHLRFRASGKGIWRGGSISGAMGEWGKMIATPGYLESDCAASECKLVARDIWNLLGGKARFVFASQSKTVYSMKDWNNARRASVSLPPTIRMDAEDIEKELIDWSQFPVPKTVVCAPYLDDNGKLQDPFLHGDPEHPDPSQYFNPMFEGYHP